MVSIRRRDGNANVKRPNSFRLEGKTTTLQMHHTFLYISYAFLHDYEVHLPNFVFYGDRKQAATKLYFAF